MKPSLAISHAIPLEFEDRWKNTQGRMEIYLLRLAILRDFVRKVHIEKSEAMVRGESKDAIQRLSDLETRLVELRDRSSLEGTLQNLVARKPVTPPRPCSLPKGLLATLGPDKLERIDRDWEAAIASEACKIGWEFWAFDVAIPLARAEEQDTEIGTALGLNGIVLYVEASPVLKANASGTWGGRWVVICRSGYDKLPAFPSGKWCRIFSLNSRA